MRVKHHRQLQNKLVASAASQQTAGIWSCRPRVAFPPNCCRVWRGGRVKKQGLARRQGTLSDIRSDVMRQRWRLIIVRQSMKPPNPTNQLTHLLGKIGLIGLVGAMTFSLFFFDPKSLEALPKDQLAIMRVSSKPSAAGKQVEIFFLIPWPLNSLQPVELIERTPSPRELTIRHFLLSVLVLSLYFFLVLLLGFTTIKSLLSKGSRNA